MKYKLDVIDEILDIDDSWAIDYFPQHTHNLQNINKVEEYLLSDIGRNLYAEKIVQIILKIIPYYNYTIWIGEVRDKKRNKELIAYSEKFLDKDMSMLDIVDILKKAIVNEVGTTILLEPEMIVLSVDLLNTGMYYKKYEEQKVIRLAVESEGMFLWKPEK